MREQVLFLWGISISIILDISSFQEEEDDDENRMSEEAERQYQQNKLQADSIVQTDQPETVVSTSFVNLNFEMEEDCEVITESKQNPVSVPPQNEMTIKL